MQATRSALSTAPVYADIPARDLNRARDFYENVLGLETQDIDAGTFAVTAGKGTMCMVYKTQATDEATVVTFLVGDIARVMNELKERGVTFEDYDMPGLKTVGGVADFGGSKMAWFKDSEGNVLSVGQMPKAEDVIL